MADTNISDLSASQAMNPYSYGLNNPLGYLDSTGQCPLLVSLALFAASQIVAALAATAITMGITGKASAWDIFLEAAAITIASTLLIGGMAGFGGISFPISAFTGSTLIATVGSAVGGIARGLPLDQIAVQMVITLTFTMAASFMEEGSDKMVNAISARLAEALKTEICRDLVLTTSATAMAGLMINIGTGLGSNLLFQTSADNM